MADVSSVKAEDIKEINDGLDSLSCEYQSGHEVANFKVTYTRIQHAS